jgi:hypothetical protein
LQTQRACSASSGISTSCGLPLAALSVHSVFAWRSSAAAITAFEASRMGWVER